MGSHPQRTDALTALESELTAVLARMDDFEERYALQLERVHPKQRRGALNLVHYLALRQSTTRAMASELTALGLSALDRVEAHVRSSVEAVVTNLRGLQGRLDSDAAPSTSRTAVSVRTARARIRRQTARLLGPKREGASTRIMVTMPTEAAEDYELVLGFVKAGMNVARVNCAHDDPAVWRAMIGNVRTAARMVGREVRIFMDLAGPKIRIGALSGGPRVVKIDPKRDARGRVARPELVSIVPETRSSPAVDGVCLPMRGAAADALEAGGRIEFVDTTGRSVSFELEDVVEGIGRAWAEETIYVETGLPVTLVSPDGTPSASGEFAELPESESRMLLRIDDVLTLHKDPRPGEAPIPEEEAGGPRPGHVSCTLPEVVDALRVGEPVFISDGTVQGEVIALRPGEADVRIIRAGPKGTRVKAFKGLNLPETDLRLYGLTDKDRQDLSFVVEHADGVDVSFLNHPDDVEDLLDELERAGGHHLGLVLKIETRGAVKHLPAILLAAMEWHTVGVMVARGDLAVEAGWAELAEVIEEILMSCEAAHLPTIWATEVLSQLAKKGIPARAEVSDVVMAGRADCVMLNKGPYIEDAIRGLDMVLARLEAYRSKRATWLPELPLQLPDPEEVGRGIGARQGRWQTSRGEG